MANMAKPAITVRTPQRLKGLDSQALAPFGAASVDHSTATAALHANEKTVGTGATRLGRLVGAFHGNTL
jgi:hypothetical protein